MLDILMWIIVGWGVLLLIVNVWIPSIRYRYHYGVWDESVSGVGEEQFVSNWGYALHGALLIFMLLVGWLIPFLA